MMNFMIKKMAKLVCVVLLIIFTAQLCKKTKTNKNKMKCSMREFKHLKIIDKAFDLM